jgi:hypothetical protein
VRIRSDGENATGPTTRVAIEISDADATLPRLCRAFHLDIATLLVQRLVVFRLNPVFSSIEHWPEVP